MLTSRQKILHYISEQGNATVEELSHALNVTTANIRHHLAVLVDQGSVMVIGSKPATFRGRPSQVYSLVQQSLRNNLESLTDILLSELKQNPISGEDGVLLKNVAAQLASKYKIDSSNPTRRLYSTIGILNQMNYRSHWEAHVEKPLIIFDHCPYKPIVGRHPEVCLIDKYILETLLSTPVEQIEKDTTNLKGLPQCVFILMGF